MTTYFVISLVVGCVAAVAFAQAMNFEPVGIAVVALIAGCLWPLAIVAIPIALLVRNSNPQG